MPVAAEAAGFFLVGTEMDGQDRLAEGGGVGERSQGRAVQRGDQHHHQMSQLLGTLLCLRLAGARRLRGAGRCR